MVRRSEGGGGGGRGDWEGVLVWITPFPWRQVFGGVKIAERARGGFPCLAAATHVLIVGEIV